MNWMKDVQAWEGIFRFEDDVADALESLSSALSVHGENARVHLRGQGTMVAVTIGSSSGSIHNDALRAKWASGEGSHLGLEDDV